MSEVCVYGVTISGEALAVRPSQAGEPLAPVDIAVAPFYWTEAVGDDGFAATALKVAKLHSEYLRDRHNNADDALFVDLYIEFIGADSTLVSAHDMRGLVIPDSGSVYAYEK